MDLQEHLKKIHQNIKKGHEDGSAHHNEMAAMHSAMLGKHDEKSEDHQFHKGAAESHLVARDNCDARAAECDKGISECSKADSGSLKKIQILDSDPDVKAYIAQKVAEAIGNTIVPSSVRVIIPSAPASARSDLIAIPRTGQRTVAAAAAVPVEFAKLFDPEFTELR